MVNGGNARSIYDFHLWLPWVGWAVIDAFAFDGAPSNPLYFSWSRYAFAPLRRSLDLLFLSRNAIGARQLLEGGDRGSAIQAWSVGGLRIIFDALLSKMILQPLFSFYWSPSLS